ncbi:MAG: diversity-generating retroelement protein Avd [Chloracidobacterium sp.]|nr:diversity-generating retroelement protein Avd [Chloracidobacterium sp.]
MRTKGQRGVVGAGSAAVGLSVVEKVYALVKWYVPVLNRLPRDHKYGLGERLINELYGMLEDLVRAQYRRSKAEVLEQVNARLQVARYQTRLLLEFELIDLRRYAYVARLMDEIGAEVGGWRKQQAARAAAEATATEGGGEGDETAGRTV